MKRDLLDRLPVINRARDYRLYTCSGLKIVDFYQDGGNAVLGHRSSGLSLSMKQSLDKGVLFSCRTRYDSRLKKAVELLAGKNTGFSVFPGKESLFSGLGRDIPPFFTEENEKNNNIKDKNKKEKKNHQNISNFPEKNASGISPGNLPVSDTVFWHPFSGDSLKEMLEKYLFVVPVIPFPGTLSPWLVLSGSPSLPANGRVSPAALAPFITAVCNIVNSPEDLYKTWDSEHEKMSSLWNRKGIYLIPQYKENFHEKIFMNLLDKGYLISPDYNIPSILPGKISKGEKDNFIKTVIKIAGEIF